MNQHFPFKQAPLPYSYISLEPYIDADTMYIHHDVIYKEYITQLNRLLMHHPEYYDWSLKRLLTDKLYLPTVEQNAVRSSAGGIYKHELFFNSMINEPNNRPFGKLRTALEAAYGSVENFETLFAQAAVSRQGSGSVWLVSNGNGGVHIVVTRDQETPALLSVTPIFVVDVWEHSYFLKYQTQRDLYVYNWFSVLDWEKAEKRFLQSCHKN